MKNANTKSRVSSVSKLRASSVSKLRARLLKSWAAVSVLAASLLFIGLLTGCPHNQPSAVDQPPAKPVDPAAILKTNGYGKITGYKCAKEELPSHLVIPAKIGDEEIKEIGWWAFSGCTGLTSVTLTASLTTIGYSAFYGCTGLTSLDLSACTNLTLIGSYAFCDCTGLTSITLPANLTKIGGGAFECYTGLTSAVFADKNGWAMYDDYKYENKAADIQQNDLADTSKAAKYLRVNTYNGGYSGKYWKKN